MDKFRQLRRPNLYQLSGPLAIQEGTEVSLVHQSSRVYPTAYTGNRKTTTPVFSLNAYCSVNHNQQFKVTRKIIREGFESNNNSAGLQGHVLLKGVYEIKYNLY